MTAEIHYRYLMGVSFWMLLIRSVTSLQLAPTNNYHRSGADFSRIRQRQKPTFLSFSSVSTWHARQRTSETRLYQSSSSLQQSEKSSQGSSPPSSTLSTKTIERKVVELGKKGMTDEALALYYSVSRPSVRLMNSAIDACARARPTRLQEAFRILEESTSSHTKPNVFTFGALMSACARARKGEQAKRLLKTMEEKYGVVPNAIVYSSAIAAVARTDPPRPDIAIQLLQEASDRGLFMNVVGYNAAISACAKAGDWKRATGLLNQLDSHNNNNGTQPDHVTYGTVLSACEKGEQWDLVLDYATAMHERNLDLDALAITSVLKACQQLGLAREALYYLQMMKNTTFSENYVRKTSGWERTGVKQPLQGADAVAYRLAISACARGGAWKEGIELLEDFQNVTGQAPDVMAYTAAITGCEYAGEWRRAFTLLNSMRKKGVEPNEVTLSAVIGACATACAKQSAGIAFRETKTEPMSLPQHKALQLLKIMKNDDSIVSPNIVVYNAAIRVCAEACDLKRALLLMKDLRQQGLDPTVVTFGSLMTAAERVGSIEGTNTVFRLMKECDMESNEIIYGAAISCCRKAGQSERAFLLLKKMIRDGLSPNVATFNTAVVAQGEGRPIEECLDRAILIYKIMQSKSNLVSRPNRQTYNLLIRAFAAAKKPQEAEALLRRMGQEGFVPDVDLYSATVTAYEKTGQPMNALRLMESMREDGYDFYEVEVLNAAFKKAVKLVNAVGRGFNEKEEMPIEFVTDEDDDDNLITKR